MNYQETLDYLYTRLPMFQRVGAAAYKADLKNILSISDLLGNPEKKFRSIHVAGTNGKGSVSHYLAAILQQAGYTTGLYTSPHLKDFRERIKVNGQSIAQQYVVDFVAKHKSDFEQLSPSFFELTVGLAFDYFASQNVDFAIIETGMGGRLDATNIINPILSVITNISLDHVAFLGTNLTDIANEKAGIIKPNVPVVIGETHEETKNVFINKTKQLNSSFSFADKQFKAQHLHYRNNEQLLLSMDIVAEKKLLYSNLETELLGNYQQKNIPTVLSALELLKIQSINISEKNIRDGIKNVVKLTGLLGRWQVLSQNPMVIVDIAHNEAGINEVVKQIQETSHHQLHFVLGMAGDKDVSGILNILPKQAKYYFCRANIPRALAVDILRSKGLEFGLSGEVYSSVKIAFDAAKSAASKEDMVFVGGSAFVVAEALE